MLCLTYDTPSSWAEVALSDPPTLLLDHFFLERKAAAQAGLVNRVLLDLGHTQFERDLRRIVGEEEAHAELVEQKLREYDRAPRPLYGNRYVQTLRSWAVERGMPLLDRLIVSALIEARSAERFRALAEVARGTQLGGFYEDFFDAEIDHYRFFVRCAEEAVSPRRARVRLAELAAREGELVQSLPAESRVH